LQHLSSQEVKHEGEEDALADALIGTAVPILLLMGIGFLSRKLGILKQGDERVLSAYVYFFALPALFLVDLAETSFGAETLSLAFFGIPFVTFAFPSEQTEHLATLAAATIGIVAIAVSITMLEFYRLRESAKREGLKQVAVRLAKNPLIISIVVGILISVVGVEIPSPVSTFLHMMGGTTSAVAVFMLGAFLYGKKYENLTVAFGLSLLRIVFLPVVALATLALFRLPSMNQSLLVLMHAMPVAVSLSVLSERYDFHRETVASLTLISSLGAIVYLNIWLLILGI
jgi:predicted permease